MCVLRMGLIHLHIPWVLEFIMFRAQMWIAAKALTTTKEDRHIAGGIQRVCLSLYILPEDQTTRQQRDPASTTQQTRILSKHVTVRL